MVIKTFSAQETADLSNEWMRRYIEEPEAFQAQFKTVSLFLAEEGAGREPTYGENCVGYLEFLRRDVAEKQQAIASENSAAIEELFSLRSRKPARKPTRKSKSKSKKRK